MSHLVLESHQTQGTPPHTSISMISFSLSLPLSLSLYIIDIYHLVLERVIKHETLPRAPGPRLPSHPYPTALGDNQPEVATQAEV